MTPDERDRIMARLVATWPTPPMAESQAVVWNEHLDPMVFGAALRALSYLEKNSRRRPAISDFHEAYAAQPRAHGTNEVMPPVCAVCEDGFIIVRCEGCNCFARFTDDGRCPAKSTQNLARCPSGCKPMTLDQRTARDRREEQQYQQARKRERDADLDLRFDRLADVVDPSEPRQTGPF